MRLRTAAVVIALTMLVCVVAVAAREAPRGSPGERTEARDRPPDVVEAPPAEFPVPGALPPEVFVIEPEQEPGPTTWLLWTIAASALAGVLGAVVMLVRDLRGRGGWWPRRRRRGGPTAAETVPVPASGGGTEDDAEAARSAVDAALEPLRGPTDARAAVIEAYSRLEQVLAQRELGRRAPEAPREYLGRVLLERGVPERSLTVLTALFEEARFSLHPIPPSATRRALSELENARAAMAAMDEQHPSGAGGLDR
jgi:Domain of unknown function (DUF4129)